MLLPTNDHEHTDDELAEAVPTWVLVGMIAWLVPALLVTAPLAAVAALLSRLKRADASFVDPIKAALVAARLRDQEGAA
jgi:hypothetical protein